jgi:hypothetical protein
MTRSNPTDRSKLGIKRHILTDKNGIPLSVVISSASTHDVKLVTDVADNAVIKRHISSPKTKNARKRKQHLCLDKACIQTRRTRNSKTRNVLHLPYKRRREEKMKKKRSRL